MIKTQNTPTPFQKETFFDMAFLPMGASFIGPRLVESIAPQALLIGGVVNALAFSVAKYVLNNSCENRPFYQFTTTAAALMLGVFATPTISNWTGIILSSQEAVMISGISLALKAAGYGIYTLLKKAVFPKLQKAEDVQALYSFQLWPLHFYYTKRPESLNQTDLRFQTALNQRFLGEKFETFPITEFSKIGEGFTSEELAFLGQQFEKVSWSLEQRQQMISLFYNNSNNLEGVDFEKDDLALISLDLDEKGARELSVSQLHWMHLAISKRREAPADKVVCRVLAERFYACKLPTPDFNIFLDRPTFPSSFDPIKTEEKYMISWLYNYYRHHREEWKKLSIENQYKYDKCFDTELKKPCVLFPSEESLDAESTIIKALHKQYQVCRGVWFEVCPFLQKKLIEKFRETDGSTVLKPFPTRVEDLVGLVGKDIDSFHQLMRFDDTLYSKMDSDTRWAFGVRCAERGLPFPAQPSWLAQQFGRH